MSFSYFQQIMKDSDGCYSNKRFISTAAFFFVSVAFFANLFWGLAMSAVVFNSMTTVVMAGLASAVGEKFAVAWVDRKKAETSEEDPADFDSDTGATKKGAN